MTDRTSSKPIIRPDLAQALRMISALMLFGRVQITEYWEPAGNPVRMVTAVLVNVTDRTRERDHILPVINHKGPVEWRGDQGITYREWHGTLLTMHLILSERIFDGDELTSDPASRAAIAAMTGPESYVPANSGPGYTRAERPPYRVASTPGAQTPSDGALLATLLTSAGPWRPAAVEVPREPGQTTAQLQERYAGIPGVVVVPGIPRATAGSDAEVTAAWAQYARARALIDFGAKTRLQQFPTLADALTAVNCWQGRDMLEDEDALAVAQQLVASSNEPVDIPTEQSRARGRLVAFLPWFAAKTARAGVS